MINKIIVFGVVGGLLAMWIIIYIIALVKTHTKPFELSDDDLFLRAFGKKEEKGDEASSNNNNPSV